MPYTGGYAVGHKVTADARRIHGVHDRFHTDTPRLPHRVVKPRAVKVGWQRRIL